MPTLVTGCNATETAGNTYLYGSYAYVSDGQFSEDAAVAFQGTVTADFLGFAIPPALSSVTGMRILWGKIDYGPAIAWDEGYIDYYDNWVGNIISISVYRQNGQYYGTLYHTRDGASLSQTSRGSLGGTENLLVHELDSSFWTNPPKIVISSPSGYVGVCDVAIELTYTEAQHSYAKDQTPPTTTTPRTILAANLFSSATGVFSVASTTTPAALEKRLVIVKPNISDPGTWYWEDYGFWYLGTIT